MTISEPELRALLAGVRTIAIIGLSANPARPSNQVAAFLVARGFVCVGVNPGIAGQRVHGIAVAARLADIRHPFDMVDVFRASEAVGGVVEDVLALKARPRILWMQLGVLDTKAAAKATTAGLTVVMDRCPKIVLGGG